MYFDIDYYTILHVMICHNNNKSILCSQYQFNSIHTFISDIKSLYTIKYTYN